MSAGSFCRSASRVTVTGARACAKPAASAADWPLLRPSRSTRMRGSAAASRASTAGEPSVEPSSTRSSS